VNYFKEVVEKEVVNEDCVKKASKINDSLRHVICVVMKYPLQCSVGSRPETDFSV
jgi:hypothetical protein